MQTSSGISNIIKQANFAHQSGFKIMFWCFLYNGVTFEAIAETLKVHHIGVIVDTCSLVGACVTCSSIPCNRSPVLSRYRQFKSPSVLFIHGLVPMFEKHVNEIWMHISSKTIAMDIMNKSSTFKSFSSDWCLLKNWKWENTITEFPCRHALIDKGHGQTSDRRPTNVLSYIWQWPRSIGVTLVKLYLVSDNHLSCAPCICYI